MCVCGGGGGCLCVFGARKESIFCLNIQNYLQQCRGKVSISCLKSVFVKCTTRIYFLFICKDS